MGLETQGFLVNCWYVAAWDHELAGGKLLARTPVSYTHLTLPTNREV